MTNTSDKNEEYTSDVDKTMDVVSKFMKKIINAKDVQVIKAAKVDDG